MNDESIIKIENLSFIYDQGKPNEFKALKNINLEIKRGEYAAFFGPSGCGKTTLLYSIAGIEKPTTGSLLVNGKNIANLSPTELAIYRQTEIGIIFQSFNLIPSITVMDNVAMPMAFLGVEQEERQKKSMEILNRLNIGHIAKRYPHELSGGQQQRVGIARALINDPHVMLADEPLGNLDSENAKNVLEFLKELNQKYGQTIIMVTHEAWSLRDATKTFHMKDGEITKVESKNAPEFAEPQPVHHFESLPVESRAKSIAHLLLRGFSEKEIERLEILLGNFLREEMDLPTLIQSLDKPFKDGGVGLWKQRAERIGKLVAAEVTEEKNLANIYAKLNKNPETPLYQEIMETRDWLFEGIKLKLTPLQMEQMGELIEERIRGVITAENFTDTIILPKKKGGVGLNTRTGLKLGDKFEALLGGKNMILHDNA